LAPHDQAILSMLVHGVPPAEIASRLEMTPGELEARRQLIVRTIAPKGARAGVSPGSGLVLDYDRQLRRQRYRGPS
jgi:hypothetical protein